MLEKVAIAAFHDELEKVAFTPFLKSLGKAGLKGLKSALWAKPISAAKKLRGDYTAATESFGRLRKVPKGLRPLKSKRPKTIGKIKMPEEGKIRRLSTAKHTKNMNQLSESAKEAAKAFAAPAATVGGAGYLAFRD